MYFVTPCIWRCPWGCKTVELGLPTALRYAFTLLPCALLPSDVFAAAWVELYTTKNKIYSFLENFFLSYSGDMKRTDLYYKNLLNYAHKQSGSYRLLALNLGAPSGPAVQMWRVNGVPYKWRPELDKRYGASYRRSLHTP